MREFSFKLLQQVVVLIAFFFSAQAIAADLYWVNGSGDWNDPNHWSSTSGGSPTGVVPSPSDNVIFDEQSFQDDYSEVFLPLDVTVNSITMNSSELFGIVGPGRTLRVAGNFLAQNGYHFNLERITFDSPGTHQINTADVAIGANLYFENGTWQLQSTLQARRSRDIHFVQGSLEANGFTIAAENVFANDNPYEFDLTGAYVGAFSNIDFSQAVNLGGSAQFKSHGNLDVSEDQKGEFSSSSFERDQTLNCGTAPNDFQIDITTLDYNDCIPPQSCTPNVSCDGVCDGEITVVASGSAGPYSYSVDAGGFTAQTFYPGQCQGNRLVEVIDSSFQVFPGVYLQCSAFEFLCSPPVLNASVQFDAPVSCFGTCDGTIALNIVGGTCNYTTTWDNGEVTSTAVNLCAGPNDVTIVDANGCTENFTFNVAGPPEIVPSLTITEPTCNGDADGEVAVSVSGGNGGPYTFSWNPVPTSGQGTNPGVGFAAGPITLSVFDVDGCQRDTTFNMTEPPVLTVSATNVADASCFGTCDGEADATAAGGAGNNTFEWFTCPKPGASTGITDEDPTTLCAGDYYVVVTDDGSAGCSAESACITISEPPQLDATAQSYDISCFGVCDGSVDVDATGGTPPYGYSWVTVPGGVGVGATDSLSGLCAGLFEITVTDDNGCNSTPDTVEVIEPPQLNLSIAGTDPTCYDLCDGTATATPGGGTPGYNYSWSPAPGTGQGTPTPTDMCPGVYTLDLTDSQGCTLQDQVTITAPPQYDISATQTDLVCNGDANGTIDITINAGGSGSGYTFNWAPNPPVGQGTASVSGLTAGSWCVTVADDMGCDTTICYTITEPPLLTANASVISHASCFGDCNGSAQVVINGGVGPYSTTWTPGGQTSLVANNLCAGNYTVDIVDVNGCTASDNVTINEPAPFDLDTSSVNNLCFGDCNGTATANVLSGGTGPYNHLWDDPFTQTTPTATALCAGNYNVTITDQNLCDTTVSFTIAEPPVITIDTNVTNSACFGSCSGEANVVVAGGTGVYTFEWFDATTGLPLGVNNDSVSTLCPGEYYAEVTDANGCSAVSDTMTITELPQINTSVISTTDNTCGLCDGSAEVLATGGAGGFTYTWNPAPGGGQGTAIATGLCGGSYSVTVTDAAGCTANIAVNISSIATETTTMDSTNISCFGLCDGTATINYTSVDPPYTVEWFDNITGNPLGIVDGPPASNPSTATNLCAGEYLAVLTNGSGCVTTDTVSVIEPPEIIGTMASTNVSCNGLCDGTATVTASGGTGALTYNWIPLPGSGQGTPAASGLCAGSWDVEVTDSQGCTEVFSANITEPVVLVISNESSTNISCFGANDGTATVISNGGTAPYTYEWVDCNSGLPIGQTNATATNLGPGDYQVVVTDANGCTVTSSCLPVIEPTQINATLNTSQVNCYGFCDGVIDVQASGGTAPYFYQWQDEFNNDIPGQTNDTINNLCQGVYYVVVTDFNGCSQTFGPVDMTSPTDPWDVSVSQTDITCSGLCDGTASVTVNSGNTPPYTYLWDDPLTQTTATATNLCAGTYNVTISDAGVCDTTIQFTIIDASPILANANITNINCFGDCSGEIDLSPSGGTAPYTVTWSDFQVGDTAFALCAGNITATVTDAAGCFIDTTINITEPPELTATSSFSNNASCGACNGSATVNVSGGVGPYTYVWAPAPGAGQGTNNATGLCPGVTTCTITDANGCAIVESFGISDVNAEVLTMDSTDVSCFGLCDGGAEVLYVCSDPGCTNQWFDGGTGSAIVGETNTTISGLCSGDYFVEVTNASGCVAVGTTTVNSPTQIIANETITAITCNGSDDGTISLAPSGGSGAGYTYTWTPVPPNGQGNSSATGLGGGTWCVDITDSDNCTESYCYDLIEPVPITITPTVTEPLCNGDCNGIISVAVTGGWGVYNYQWLDGGGAPIPGETNPLIGGLCAGNTTIEVTDSLGCVESLTITLSEPSAVTATISDTDVLCFGDCDGTATVAPSGGFAPYTVNWYNNTTGNLIGQTGTTATNLCPEFYHAVITDDNGCSTTTAATEIVEPPELTWTLNESDATCFGICDGAAAITPAGGTPAYTYEWLDISGNPIVGGTNQNVSNLCAGNYTVQLTDANGCTSGVQPVVINGFPEITGNVFTNDATCGVNDGNATVFAAGGNPPFTYQWFDNLLNPLAGETNNQLLNVGSGTYYVDVTDANGCTETFMANISDLPSTTLTWDAVNDPSCFGASDGSLSVTATGVNLPLTYTWNPGGIIAEDPTGLTAGNYTLQLTDALGCINFYDTTLVDPAEIIVTPTVTASDCDQCNGTISLSVSGGTGALSVLWNDGSSGTNLSGLCPSIYEAQVTDANGCLVTEQVDVPNTGGLTGDETITAITCPDACDGAVTVTGIGGTPPYAYQWLHDGSTSDTQSNLCEGSYFVTITDADGCNYSIETEMLNPPSVNAVPTITNPTCGNNDGSIVVMTSGGVLPHTYLWTPGGNVTNSISNLGAGMYTLTVTDNAGCSEDFVYGLSNSDAPVATLNVTDISCASACTGQIDTSSVTGGTTPYTYQWLDDTGTPIVGEVNPLISALCAGDYMLEITDNAGCISYVDATVTEPDTIILNPLFEVDPSCAGLCDGQLIANPIGGTLPFSFIWDDPDNQTTILADSLCDGTYSVQISDANVCIANQSGTVTEPSQITVVTDSITDATCLNSADGEIYITATGGTPGYTYEWVSQSLTDTLTAEDPTGLMPMDYYLTVTDTNGCQMMDTMSVDTVLVVLVDGGLDTLICFGGSYGLNAVSNVDPGADYTWYDTTGAQISDTSVYAVAGATTPGVYTYIVDVTYSGCSHQDTVNVTVTTDFTVEAGPDVEMFANQTEVIGGNPTSNDPTHTYAWTPPDFLSDTTDSNPSIIEPQASGYYYVIATDTNGCTAIDSMWLELRPELVIPDGISPDGNGLNDTWILDFIELYPGVDIEIAVYNRWGETLFASDENYQDDWGGTTSDGKRLPAGTYYYVITVDHPDFPEPLNGPITIMW